VSHRSSRAQTTSTSGPASWVARWSAQVRHGQRGHSFCSGSGGFRDARESDPRRGWACARRKRVLLTVADYLLKRSKGRRPLFIRTRLSHFQRLGEGVSEEGIFANALLLVTDITTHAGSGPEQAKKSPNEEVRSSVEDWASTAAVPAKRDTQRNGALRVDHLSVARFVAAVGAGDRHDGGFPRSFRGGWNQALIRSTSRVALASRSWGSRACHPEFEESGELSVGELTRSGRLRPRSSFREKLMLDLVDPLEVRGKKPPAE
jgi:hypothetical protein